MKAEIITVGTEILLGDILNTNCRYLSRELAAMGIEMYYQITVGDNEERLLKTLEESLNRSDIVICTRCGPRNPSRSRFAPPSRASSTASPACAVACSRSSPRLWCFLKPFRPLCGASSAS